MWSDACALLPQCEKGAGLELLYSVLHVGLSITRGNSAGRWRQPMTAWYQPLQQSRKPAKTQVSPVTCSESGHNDDLPIHSLIPVDPSPHQEASRFSGASEVWCCRSPRSRTLLWHWTVLNRSILFNLTSVIAVSGDTHPLESPALGSTR